MTIPVGHAVAVSNGKTNIPTVVERFMALFAGHPNVHGTHGEPELDSNGIKWSIKRTARTKGEPVTAAHWQWHLTGERPLGIVPINPDNQCRWGSIDYDQYEADQSPLLCAAANLPFVPCRSKSGGLHLFLFLQDPQPAGAVQAVLRKLASQIGVAGSEIFPKQQQLSEDASGNWMCMPYLGTDYGGKLRKQVGVGADGAEYSAEEFLQVAEARRLTKEQLAELGATRRTRASSRSDMPPCLEKIKKDKQRNGGRNNATFQAGVYLKRVDELTWETALDDWNARYNVPPLDSAEMNQLKNSLKKSEYHYLCKTEPMQSLCDRAACIKRKYGVTTDRRPYIDHIEIRLTHPKKYYVHLDGGAVVECGSRDLNKFTLFAECCTEQIQRRFVPMKEVEWAKEVDDALLTAVERPPEADEAKGTLLHEALVQFLTNRGMATRKEELANGVPWFDEENQQYWFSMDSFQGWLAREKRTAVKESRSEIIDHVRYRGATPQRAAETQWGQQEVLVAPEGRGGGCAT